jgi:putative SOS response-associated peptidase YedK
MCGRFAFFSPEEAIIAAFGVAAAGGLKPRYNIAPSQELLTIRLDEGQMIADQLRWGLVPFWAKDPAIGNRMINARAETLAEKPSFRQALRRRRCLIPANGFFEWKKDPGTNARQPWYISSANSELLAFAGLWEEWQGGDGEELRTCTIVTTAANPFLSELHHRMPLILSKAEYSTWLDLQSAREDVNLLLTGMPTPELQFWPVSRKVNSPLNDEPELIEQVAL